MTIHSKRDPSRDGEVGAGSLAFTLTKPVDLARLDAEVTEAHGWRNSAGLVAEGDATSASPDNPVTLWVLREDAQHSTVRKAVTAHEGVVATAPDELDSLRAVVAAGDPLSQEQVAAAVRLLLMKGN